MFSRLLTYLKNVYISRCCEGGWRVYVSKNAGKYEWADPRGFDGQAPGKKEQPHFRAFIADPFLFHYSGTNWLFFETVGPEAVASGLKGKIGCLKEDSGHWINQGIVLEKPWHMSYPQVFEENGHIYMIPEQSALGEGDVSLYEAKDFPRGWVKVKTLIDRPFADATLLRKDGYYYMACYTIPPRESAELWCAPSLLGPWTRHSEWQNISQSPKYRRCGGAFLEKEGKLYRMAQDCDGGYGLRLYKVPVQEISPAHYREGTPELFLDETMVVRQFKHTYNEIAIDGEKISVFDCHWHTPLPIFEMISVLSNRALDKIRRIIGLSRREDTCHSARDKNR